MNDLRGMKAKTGVFMQRATYCYFAFRALRGFQLFLHGFQDSKGLESFFSPHLPILIGSRIVHESEMILADYFHYAVLLQGLIPRTAAAGEENSLLWYIAEPSLVLKI